MMKLENTQYILVCFPSFSGQQIDSVTETIPTDYQSMYVTESIKIVTLMTLKSPPKHIGFITMQTFTIAVCISLLTLILLLIARKYFNARRTARRSAALDTRSIKYISNKQLNKIHIDMGDENAQNDDRHRNNSESGIDANENQKTKINVNIFDRVKQRIYRSTASVAGRYSNLNETN